MYLYLTFHNNGFCHSPLENHWVILSVCYHHLGVSRWAEKILPCHQLMPYKRIQFRGANLCEAPRNCECVSSPSIETESQKEKEVPEKENATALPSAPPDQRAALQVSRQSWLLPKKATPAPAILLVVNKIWALSWLHIFGANVPGEGKSYSHMW